MEKNDDDREKALALLAEGAASGPAFFEIAARALEAGLGYRWTGVMAYDRATDRISHLSFREAGRNREPGNHNVSESPCAPLYRGESAGAHIFIGEGLVERFPLLHGLRAMGAVCYRGEVFLGADGDLAGHIFATDDKPHRDRPETRAFFNLVARRVGTEYTRWRA